MGGLLEQWQADAHQVHACMYRPATVAPEVATILQDPPPVDLTVVLVEN
jgi:hypothetical protein